MANPRWPEDVPLRYAPTSYQELDDGGVIRSATDSGRHKTRRRFATRITSRQFTLQLSDGERDTLRAWFNDMAAGGALVFDWMPPTATGTLERGRLVVPRGGLRWRRADRLAGEAIRWTLALTVEVMP